VSGAEEAAGDLVFLFTNRDVEDLDVVTGSAERTRQIGQAERTIRLGHFLGSKLQRGVHEKETRALGPKRAPSFMDQCLLLSRQEAHPKEKRRLHIRQTRWLSKQRTMHLDTVHPSQESKRTHFSEKPAACGENPLASVHETRRSTEGKEGWDPFRPGRPQDQLRPLLFQRGGDVKSQSESIAGQPSALGLCSLPMPIVGHRQMV